MTGETHCISSLSAVGSGEVRGQVYIGDIVESSNGFLRINATFTKCTANALHKF